MSDISQIKLPNNTTYDIRDAKKSGVYAVKGTQTAITGSWTGNIDIPALYDGLSIDYFLPYKGSGNATLNLTLSDGTTTGAVVCYLNPSQRLQTQYPAGSTIHMTYWSAGSISISGNPTTVNQWMCDASYDTNSNTWRNIKVNGTEILGTGINTGALNLASGTEISLTNNSGTVTIDATTHTTVDGTTLEISRTASASPTMANVINAIYPVGSYFHSSVHTNPQTWLTGTTWEEVTNTLIAKPNFSNVIKTSTSYSNGATYTATQDCFVWYVSNPSGSAVGGMSTHQSGMTSGSYVFEDYMYAVNVVSQIQHCSFVKKGETVKLASPYQNQTYAVYGVDNKINGINTYLYHRTA